MSINKINHILFEHSYKIESKNSHFTITNEDNNATLSVISYLVGIGLLLTGVAVHVGYLFAGVLFVLLAIFREMRRAPKQVHFYKSGGYVQVVYDVFGRKKYPLSKVNEIVATTHEETNLTNPFEAGNRLYDYEFFLTLNSGKQVRVLELDFTEPCDADMQELAFYLNELIGKN